MNSPAIAASLVVALVTGCASDRRADIDAVNTAISALPGVASSSVDYDSGWRQGDRRFSLAAVLSGDATPSRPGRSVRRSPMW